MRRKASATFSAANAVAGSGVYSPFANNSRSARSRRPSHSGFAAMQADARRYVPALAALRHVDSLREIKTVLARSELDDSRPILYRRDYGMPGYTCILGGKLDNIYDALDEIGVADAA